MPKKTGYGKSGLGARTKKERGSTGYGAMTKKEQKVMKNRGSRKK